VFKDLRGYGKLTEKNISDALREIRIALLEADVHFSVVKDFLNKVKEKSLGQEVLSSITPGQQIVKIVHDELVELLGGGTLEKPKGFARVLLVGLQGAGKTTTAAKLAAWLRRQQRKRALLVSCDTQRPAAQEQLQILARQLDLPFFTVAGEKDPRRIAAQVTQQASNLGVDAVIVDTAGRLHVDDTLMQEIVQVREIIDPTEILFVADAMTGQDAVQSAKAFHDSVGVTGVILTKLDGDSRGGAALSVRWVTGKPIQFCGVGEKLDQLEPFYPDRIASRILGMGDVVSLVEKAQQTFDQDEAAVMQAKLQKGEFTFEDFLAQMRQLQKMGGLQSLLQMIPGMGELKDLKVDEKEMKRTEAIILSMTAQERRNPDLLNISRRQRIATGSGTTLADVNSLIKRFTQSQKMMKKIGPLTKTLRSKKGNALPTLPFGKQ
jgi:signal recognition particle subunit SRP54